MNTEQLYSLKEMAKELNTTWQSIRSWKEQYHQFIPMEVQDKQVRFRAEAIEILRFIQEAKEKGMDHHEIRARLAETPAPANREAASSKVDSTDATDETESNNIDLIMIDPKRLEEMQQTIRELQSEVSELKTKFSEVEVAKRDQALMDNLREIRDTKKPKKGLWSRVMNFTL